MLMKQLLTLLMLTTTLTAAAQTHWRTLPPNTNADVLMPESWDIAVAPDGSAYMVYAVTDNGNDEYDIYFDRYTTASGWETLELYNTDVDPDENISVQTVHSGSAIYALANTNNGDHITVFSISGDNVDELDTENFPGLTPAGSWKVYPGKDSNELFFTYSTKLYRFNEPANNWENAGNVFAGSGLSVFATSVYANEDSVFVVGQYLNAGVPKLRLRAASRQNWTWSNYSSGDVYAMNGAAVDTLTGYDGFYLFGDHQHTMGLIGQDNGNAEMFYIGQGAYGQQQVFPPDYDPDAQVAYTGSGAYMIARASNLGEPNVVYRLDYPGTSWSQEGAEFAPLAVQADEKHIKANPQTERLMLGYVDAATEERSLLLSNNEPEISSPGTASTELCANTTADLLSWLTIFDQDDDDIVLLNVLSSDPAVIDPAGIDANVTNTMTNYSMVFAEAPIGNVSAVQTVTLTFNFTDGFDPLQHSVTYTVHPGAQSQFVVDEVTLCSNGDAIDLYDYAGTPGGSFSITGSDFEGHYFDPVLYTSADFPAEVIYTVGNGACASQDTLTLLYLEAPTATITAQPSTNCTQNNGSAELDISGGTAPYQFVWSVGNNTDLTVTGLAPGTVHADILDDAGCFAVADAVIANDGATLTAVVSPVSCYAAADGAIDLSVSGMTGPLTIIWSNGYSTEDVTNLQPGSHIVWVTDASECTVVETFVVPTPDALELEIATQNSECNDATGSASVSTLTGGTEPYEYSWNTGETDDDITGMPSGLYELTVTDANGCTVTRGCGISDNGAPYSENAHVIGAQCNQSNGSVSVDLVEAGTDPQFTWSSGQADTSAIWQLVPDVYTLNGTNTEGCSSYALFEVEPIAPARQQICIVTVDSATTTNLVIWEKNGDPAIDRFNIYRETMIAGQFQWIDSVSNDSESIFNDVIASPLDRSWKYRITAVDECGVESMPSTAHKTIHLTTTDIGGGNFSVMWNFYQGTTAPGYHFYRYSIPEGWQLITTTPAGLNSFTDSPTNTVGLDYMVDFDLSATCTADLQKSQDFNSSRSNKDRGMFSAGEGTGDSNNGLIEAPFGNGSVMLYPNPVTGSEAFIVLDDVAAADYRLLSLTGQEVSNGQLQEGITSLNVAQLEAGMYVLHLDNGNEHTILRFVVK